MKRFIWLLLYSLPLILIVACNQTTQSTNQKKKNQNTRSASGNVEEEYATIPGLRPIEELFIGEDEVFESLSQALQTPESVEKLRLIDIKLNKIPQEIFQFSNLKQLYLTANQISTLPDSFFYKLPQLEVLDLSHNQLNRMPEGLTVAKSLQYLNLSFNRLGSLPSTISDLSNLQILNISHNPFKALPQEIFYLNYLRRLFLDGIRLDSVPSIFTRLGNIEWLSLENTNLRQFPMTLLDMTSLSYINLASNQIKQIPGSINVLGNLLNLDLSNNPIQELPDEIFDKLSLKALDIAGTKVSKIPDNIENSLELVWLEMGSTPIQKLPETMANCQHLATLQLGNNPQLDLSQSLGVLSQLEGLRDLRWTRIRTGYGTWELPLEFEGLDYIRKLDLRGNNLGNLSKAIEILSNVDHLEALNLSNCNIRTITEDFRRLAKLKVLGLDIKNISQYELKKLTEYLPSVELVDGSVHFDYQIYD